MIEVTLNGEVRRIQAGITVLQLLGELGLQSRYVAVERNRDLVPRAHHQGCIIQAGDQLEIVTLVGGG